MILNINKPLGITSFDVVACVRKALGEKKVGHAGTLDPMATGVLVVAVGRESTKQIDQLMLGEKEYIAEIVLGTTTDSLDRDGKIVEIAPVPELSKEIVEASVQSFIGTIKQIPPSFSAVHVQGKRAYSLARAGIAMTLPPRIVTINKIEILAYPSPPTVRNTEELILSPEKGRCPEGRGVQHATQCPEGRGVQYATQCPEGRVVQIPPLNSEDVVVQNSSQRSISKGRVVLPEEAFDSFPQLTLKVTCEKGVYIRSLAKDIGEALGTVAFLKSLVRTKVGEYRIEDSLELESLPEIAKLRLPSPEPSQLLDQ